MPLTVKSLREILDDVVSQNVGITEDSHVLFAVGDPTEGGTIYLATETAVADHNGLDGEVEHSFFFQMDTAINVMKENMKEMLGGVDLGQQEETPTTQVEKEA